jgi:uncharacterized protein (TIGR00661 family)
MARVIYAVAGEGFGHSSRAHLIGQRFLDAGHEIMFVASQKALLYLRQYFGPRVQEISGLSFAYRNGNVDSVGTVAKNMVAFPRASRHNRALFEQVYEPFQPDLVMTDFEPFSGWWAWRKRVPFISVDNEHLLAVCKLEHRLRDIFPRLTATTVIRSYYFGAACYVVINFFKAPLRKDSAVLVPPVVRPHVTALTPSNAGHILVYSTTGTRRERLCDVLHRFADQSFYVYGFNQYAEIGNCTFKERSTEGFLADLASARGVVASAGFSLMSECMHLRKRMLLLPLAGQYEQIINARYAEKLGLGLWSKRLNETSLARFIERIGEPMPQDGSILWPDNDEFFARLRHVLAGLDTSVNLTI